MRRNHIAASVALLLGLILSAVAGRAATDDRQATIDRWRASLGQIENALQRSAITDADLDGNRSSAQTILTDALALGEQLKPLIAVAQDRLRSVAPPADVTVEESQAVKETRDRLQTELNALVGLSQQADLVTLQARQILEEIATVRTTRLTSELSLRDRSLVAPGFWADLAAGTRIFATGIAGIATTWTSAFAGTADEAGLLLAVAAVVLLVAILIGRHYLVRWAIGRRTSAPSAGQKMLMAALVVAGDVGVPLLVLSGLREALAGLGLMPEAAGALYQAVLVAVVVFAAIGGLARAILAPGRPAWRIALAMTEQTAGRVYGLLLAVAFLMALLAFVQVLAPAVQAPPTYAGAIGGVLGVLVAVLVLVAGRTLIRGRDALSEAERMRVVRWRLVTPLFAAAALVILAAGALGFLNFARFLAVQIVWIWAVLGLAVIVVGLADGGIGAAFRDEGTTGRSFARYLGLSVRSMNQVGVVASGLVHIVVALVGLLLIAGPWGLDSSSFTAGLEGLVYGIQVGSLRITLTTVLIALVIFVAGIALSKIFQNWLDRRFLPATRVDPGLRNSIQTAAGYLGVVLAAIASATYAGLDLASVAIVAGALSVGIGFGLQSIVNNFVSGLILLVERPIRTGDWIEVGTEQGTVKRISVRATEIETFERASVIIPNSTLVTGMVKNRYLRDVSGRVTVAVGVGYDADPVLVRKILMECAKSHRLVLSEPSPLVLFMDFGASALQFELRCYLADIGSGITVQSDLRFAILERLRQAGIEIPFPQQDVSIRRWPPLMPPEAPAAAPG